MGSPIPGEFPVADHHIHLNHAGVAPWPRRTADAVEAFARENRDHGSVRYLSWLDTERRLRRLGAWLINAPSADDIALLKNTSEGLSLVAYGLPWKAGDNVVGIRQEFPSNRVPWESLTGQGVQYRPLDLSTTDDPETGLADLCDRNTRVVAVSAVQFASGFRLNLERIGEFCRKRGILFCIDAIQQLGALPFDAQAVKADIVVADGHKWMLAPEGVALFYTRPEVRNRLALRQYGWHMRQHPGDYEMDAPWEPSATASRFECGSPNMIGIHALAASLSLLQEVGMDKVAAAIRERVRWLCERIANEPGFSLLSPSAPERQSGIVVLKHNETAAESLYEHLAYEGVICALRGGGVRFAPHFYTPEHQIEQAWGIVREFCR